jgi:hypothetical protein
MPSALDKLCICVSTDIGTATRCACTFQVETTSSHASPNNLISLLSLRLQGRPLHKAGNNTQSKVTVAFLHKSPSLSATLSSVFDMTGAGRIVRHPRMGAVQTGSPLPSFHVTRPSQEPQLRLELQLSHLQQTNRHAANTYCASRMHAYAPAEAPQTHILGNTARSSISSCQMLLPC